MTPSSPAATLGPQFNDFLRLQLCDARNGAPLSVLSALARLDLDPWGEAADLALLPRDSAARRLASLLGRLPDLKADPEFDTICLRSVGLLPQAAAPDIWMRPAPRVGEQTAARPQTTPYFLILAVWMAALMTLGHMASLQTAHVDAPQRSSPTHGR